MNTRISDAAVEAWARRHGLSSRTLRQAYEEAALPHMPQAGGGNPVSDDERPRFEAWAVRNGYDVSVTLDHAVMIDGVYAEGDTYSAWKVWQAALAARQPVGQPFAYGSSAGHQPIPARAYGEGCSDVYDIPLYAAPPAQAVDLGQLQRYDPSLGEHPWPYAEMIPTDDGEWVRYADVTDLIDSQA